MVKHIVFLACLDHFVQKPTPFSVIDSHAGEGLYALDNATGAKSGEWSYGIARLMAAAHPPPLAARLISAVRAVQGKPGALTRYPGSPHLAAQAIREQDKLFLIEKNAEAFAALKQRMGERAHVTLVAGDGYAWLKRAPIPANRRGLILIDPPFEEGLEFAHLARALKDVDARWPEAMVLAWYPIKDPVPVDRFISEVKSALIPEILQITFRTGAPNAAREQGEGPVRGPALSACGMLCLHPPHLLAGQLEALAPWLCAALGQGPGAALAVSWLSPPI